MSPCNSIAGLYFEGTCDVISVTMAIHKVHKNVNKTDRPNTTPTVRAISTFAVYFLVFRPFCRFTMCRLHALAP